MSDRLPDSGEDLGRIARLRRGWHRPSPDLQPASFTHLCVPAGSHLVSAIDALVAGVHYPEDTAPADVGYKALAVNLSDMAAMGAEPLALSLALVLPQPDWEWMTECMAGMNELGREFNLALGGFAFAEGPAALTVQIFGHVPHGRALTRAQARPGDEIFVTGVLGDAGLALAALDNRTVLSSAQRNRVRQRLDRPTPRVQVGIALRGIASAAIDISDGLAQDLDHILTASHTGARILTGRLPLSPTFRDALPEADRLGYALCSGDDYELCFTVPADIVPQLRAIEAELECRITRVGTIDDSAGLRFLDADGAELKLNKGFIHFG